MKEEKYLEQVKSIESELDNLSTKIEMLKGDLIDEIMED